MPFSGRFAYPSCTFFPTPTNYCSSSLSRRSGAKPYTSAAEAALPSSFVQIPYRNCPAGRTLALRRTLSASALVDRALRFINSYGA